MNLRTISKLTAAIALVCSGSAHALDISTYAENANQLTLRIGGSSAHDNGLERLFALNVGAGGTTMCAAGTLDIYKSVDGNRRLFLCTPAAGLGLGAGITRLAVFKSSAGGSGAGVGPLVRANGVGGVTGNQWLDPTTNTTALCGTTAVGATGNFAAYTQHFSCPNANITAAAGGPQTDVGISDLEPAIFKTAFSTALTNAEVAALTTKGITGVTFGVPVTLGIYQRLQAMYFAASSVCNPGNANYSAAVSFTVNGVVVNTTNADSEACMPSLTKSQLQALYSGGYGDWSMIASPTTAGVNLSTITTAAYPTALGSTNTPGGVPGGVYVCRRSNTSGTQATFETQILGQRCVNGSQTFLTNPTNVATVDVNEASSGGGVVTCLNARDASNIGAVGILSTETKPAATDKWRFVKLNGFAPTLLNVVKSNYDLFAESTLQYRGAAIGGFAALAGNQKSVADSISVAMGDVNVINDLDTTFVQSFGPAGDVGNAVALAAQAPQPPFVVNSFSSGNTSDVLAFPIATKTRGASGTPNACLPPVDISATQVTP